MSFTTPEFTDRRNRWVLPAAVLAIVVVTAVALFLAFGGSQATSALPSAPTPATPDPGESSGGRSAAAPSGTREPTDPQYLTALPAGLNWQTVQGLQLPFSPVDGPRLVDGPIAAGYSRTPQGAALAAVQIGSRLLYAAGYERVVTEQTVYDPGLRAKFLAARRASPQGTDDEIAAVVSRPLGFKMQAFTPDRATVVLALPNVNGAPGTYAVGPYTVVWVAGDWKFADNSSSVPTIVTTLAGFTPW